MVASRLFHIAVDHFFDDFWIAEPISTVKSALRCFRELAALLGFGFDQSPTAWQCAGSTWRRLRPQRSSCRRQLCGQTESRPSARVAVFGSAMSGGEKPHQPHAWRRLGGRHAGILRGASVQPALARGAEVEIPAVNEPSPPSSIDRCQKRKRAKRASSFCCEACSGGLSRKGTRWAS